MNVVDSCGWIEYLFDDRNADFFEPAIHDRDNLLVPTVCIVEVVRAVARTRGEEDAARAAVEMRLGRVVDLDARLALDAARLGVEHGLPLADSIILATARAHDAVVWTQDEHFLYKARLQRSGLSTPSAAAVGDAACNVATAT